MREAEGMQSDRRERSASQAAEAPGARLRAAYLAEECAAVAARIDEARVPAGVGERVERNAIDWIRRVRASGAGAHGIDAFMGEYDLSSEEGVLLMCLAEGLLRIPDDHTAEALIADKLGGADWAAHLGHSESLFVNASTWGLILTGRMINLPPKSRRDFTRPLQALVRRTGEPVVRSALRAAMGLMGRQFVLGESIEQALRRSRRGDNAQYRYSFDMLGEAALTETDADGYLQSYAHAIACLAAEGPYANAVDAPGISVKLSALHPRYDYRQRERLRSELPPRLLQLAQAAARANIQLTLDAEEADRLELQMDCFEAVFADSSLGQWQGLGLAVQAYQKRCPMLIDWLAALAQARRRRIPIRLVKGAYWDAEIKQAQQLGLAGYPVYTRKAHTDVAWLACARRLLNHGDCFAPQFATHNAHSLAWVDEMAGERDIELQRLHGMGEALYATYRDSPGRARPVRVYAPVGSHAELLPYLVRRLLENGANSSFVNRINDEGVAPERLASDPVTALARRPVSPHPKIPLPDDLFQPVRPNARGLNLADPLVLARLQTLLNRHPPGDWSAGPMLAAAIDTSPGAAQDSRDPTSGRVIGRWRPVQAKAVRQIVEAAVAAQAAWDARGADARADIIEAAAERLEASFGELLSLCVHEAGKTLTDAIAEIREAVDFLRYYAVQARSQFAAPQRMPGYTGESNRLQWRGRGVALTISPWNFPLAIFLGQTSAALLAGNSVIAKPAEQTPLIAQAAVRILYEAGVPDAVLQLAPGDGASVGAALVADPCVAMVAFTGSLATARQIQRSLAQRPGAIATLVAETGGQNAMIVDSSALAEQVVADVTTSAFGSGGQRCSALRVLYLQADVADRIIAMLAGAMQRLRVGDPARIDTDVGPVIDAAARDHLERHAAELTRAGRLLAETPLPPELPSGHFVAPRVFEIDSMADLHEEHFGPLLHVVRYEADALDSVIDEINNNGYGLTLGIHSRIESRAEYIAERARVGNCYVNRDMVGAIVGVQPFGGQGLSGTGPKAGGPHYLSRFATEQTVTVNTAAVGGNASLLALDED